MSYRPTQPAEPDRTLTDSDIRAMADANARAMIEALNDPDTIAALSSAGVEMIDRSLGQGVRRLVRLVFFVLAAGLAVKVGLPDWLADVLKGLSK